MIQELQNRLNPSDNRNRHSYAMQGASNSTVGFSRDLQRLMVAPATELGYAIGNADRSEDMALRIEKAFGVKMDTLMRMQASYDIAQTRKREGQIHVRRIHQAADAPA